MVGGEPARAIEILCTLGQEGEEEEPVREQD
jgi:hypothetical protein